jgi:hypothetical protein
MRKRTITVNDRMQKLCRYVRSEPLGRKLERLKAMRRHIRQIERHCEPGRLTCRIRQRQAPLHCAYDSRKI